MRTLTLLIASCVLCLPGCHGTPMPAREVSVNRDTSAFVPPVNAPGPPSRVKQTVSGVEAVIDSLTLLDGGQFSILISVTSAKVLSGDGLVPEEGQRLLLHPLFALDERGDYDKRSERNVRLGRVRAMHTGGILEGQVAFSQDGGWWLLDVAVP